MIGNTRKKRTLAGSEYNQRRADCEKAVRLLARLSGRRLKALRDVTPELLAAHMEELPERARKRAAHVVGEDERTLAAARLLGCGGQIWKRFGELMIASHDSLRVLYEVSCRELDVMVEQALEQEGCVGSRMTGAGFGGCTVSVVRGDKVEAFLRRVGQGYRKATGIKPEFYVCGTNDGVKAERI